VPPTEIMLSGFPANVALFSAYGGLPQTFFPVIDGGVPEIRAKPIEQRPVLLELPSKPPPSPHPPYMLSSEAQVTGHKSLPTALRTTPAKSHVTPVIRVLAGTGAVDFLRADASGANARPIRIANHSVRFIGTILSCLGTDFDWVGFRSIQSDPAIDAAA